MSLHSRLPSACLLFLAACASSVGRGGSEEESIAPGTARTQPAAGTPLLVTASTRIPAGEYLLPAIAGTSAEDARGVIHVEGQHGILLDLTGVSLRGNVAGTDLDESDGVGILVRDSQNVTIRGALLGGYKVCIQVEDSQGVIVEDVECDGWYGQRLLSTPFAENEADWLYPHDNDRGEWIAKYGAAISFTDCREVTVRRSHGRHGQNGILLTRTNDSEIYDNDFSFLSGWGLGMYRASKNVVSHNIFDYCVRGRSEYYSRGQDSAGILMFERCCDNVFAFNSATHGGDGVFLFAGRDTVDGLAYDRGETDVGTADRNLWYQNDLRFAAANSLEATFSEHNVAILNDLSGSNQHGVWGGYSRDMVIVGNKIDDTEGAGVTIEHGQRCLIAHNSFRNNHTGIELYWDYEANDKELVDGPYGKHYDTSSSGHWIIENTFAENDQDLLIRRSTALTAQGNEHSGPNDLLDTSGGIGAEGEQDLRPEVVRKWLSGRDGELPSGRIERSTFRRPSGGQLADLATWLDFQSPEVPGTLRTSALERGELGGLQTILMGPFGAWDFRAGEPRPERMRPGGLLAEARWDARWFSWKGEAKDPRGDLERWRALADAPLVRQTVPNFFDPFGGDETVRERVSGGSFGLIARTRIVLDRAGTHSLSVQSDDGARVLIDGHTAVEDWTWHAARTETVELSLAKGEHDLVLEYFQGDGACALSIELQRIGD